MPVNAPIQLDISISIILTVKEEKARDFAQYYQSSRDKIGWMKKGNIAV